MLFADSLLLELADRFPSRALVDEQGSDCDIHICQSGLRFITRPCEERAKTIEGTLYGELHVVI